jgi:hypothetical protein
LQRLWKKRFDEGKGGFRRALARVAESKSKWVCSTAHIAVSTFGRSVRSRRKPSLAIAMLAITLLAAAILALVPLLFG